MREIKSIPLACVKMRGKYPFDSRVLIYANKMVSGEAFPPIKVARESGFYKIVDGRHRFMAAKLASRPTIKISVSARKRKSGALD